MKNLIETGIWSSGKKSKYTHNQWAKNFQSINVDYVSIFHTLPNPDGGLIVRDLSVVRKEVETIVNAGIEPKLSYWFGTKQEYLTPNVDAINKFEKDLQKNKFAPENMEYELDMEFHTTAFSPKQASWAASQLKKELDLDTFAKRIGITFIPGIHPVIKVLILELIGYLIALRSQMYSFFNPKKQKQTEQDIFRPKNMQNYGISAYENKILKDKEVRNALKKLGVDISAVEKELENLFVCSLAVYWQKHPGYIMENGLYDIEKALIDAFETCFSKGYRKFCIFSDIWLFDQGEKREREICREFVSSIKSRYSEDEDEDCFLELKESIKISKIQYLLSSLGYDIGKFGQFGDGVDGKNGSKTISAMKSAEKKLNLKIDGIPDEMLFEQLSEEFKKHYGFEPKFDNKAEIF